MDTGERWLLSAFFSSHSKSNSNWPSNRSAYMHLSLLILLRRSSASLKLASMAIKNQRLWASKWEGYITDGEELP